MCCLWSGAPCESRDGPGIAPSRRRVAVLLSIRLTHYGPIGGVADSLDEAKGRRGDAFHFAAINDRNPRSAGTRLLHDQPLRLDHATLANEWQELGWVSRCGRTASLQLPAVRQRRGEELATN